eukprot:3490165-Pyramimonas_sp.AAC.1
MSHGRCRPDRIGVGLIELSLPAPPPRGEAWQAPTCCGSESDARQLARAQAVPPSPLRWAPRCARCALTDLRQPGSRTIKKSRRGRSRAPRMHCRPIRELQNWPMAGLLVADLSPWVTRAQENAQALLRLGSGGGVGRRKIRPALGRPNASQGQVSTVGPPRGLCWAPRRGRWVLDASAR